MKLNNILSIIAIFFGMSVAQASSLPGQAGKMPALLPVRFLPENGNCVYEGAGLLRQWPKGGPRELWRAKLGEGKSAVTEAGGRAYTLTQHDGKQWALCFDPRDGSVVWEQAIYEKEHHRHGVDGPTSSVVVDGDRIYCIPFDNLNHDREPRCPVICLNTRNGGEVWAIRGRDWATEGSTPLVHGDTLYYLAYGKEQVMIAVDKRTGKILWRVHDKADTGRLQTYGGAASPVWQEVDGIPTVVAGIFQLDHIGVHAETGEILWHWQFPRPFVSGLISSPVAIGNRLFLSGFQLKESWGACLELKTKDGKIEPRALYCDNKKQCNGFKTVSVFEGAVYGFGRGKEWDALQCTDFETGKLIWQEEGPDWSRECNATVAGGLIFALTRRDELVLAEASPKGYRELGRVKPGLKLGLQQQPMIWGGRLYLRGGDMVVCYEVGP